MKGKEVMMSECNDLIPLLVDVSGVLAHNSLTLNI